jgi:hypothetical protein
MRRHEIENWALAIIERVRQGQPVEDAQVELKATWPRDPGKAARRLAGHANAARGEPILWLIGVDEQAGTVPGVDFADLATWWSGISAAFDELAPDPVSLNVPAEGATVAALYFETDRAPFVVKNPAGGAIQREVPWREATGVKSATRSQLLKLLSPLQKVPHVEVLGAMILTERQSSLAGEPWDWRVWVTVFATQPAGQETVIPSHHSSVAFGIPQAHMLGPFSPIGFRGTELEGAVATKNSVAIRGPAIFEILFRINEEHSDPLPQVLREDAVVELTLGPAGTDRRVGARATVPLEIFTDRSVRWRLSDYAYKNL